MQTVPDYPLRILHVIPGLTRERGGPSTVVEAQVRHQLARGHKVSVLTTDQGERHGEQPIEMPVEALVRKASVLGPDRWAYAPGFRKLARQLLQQNDIVHVHSIFTYPVHVVLKEANHLGVPVMISPHGLLHPFSLKKSGWLKKGYLNLFGQMVSGPSSAWHYTSNQEATASWRGGNPKGFVLANGIDPGPYDVNRQKAREKVWQQWPQMQTQTYILFLGRLHPKKRLDILLQAFLSANLPECKLVIAGPDECGLWPSLANQFLTTRTANQKVLPLGMVVGEEKISLLAGASLFALSSEHENFGVAALEAMAAGTPVLLSPGVDFGIQARDAGFGKVIPLELKAWREGLEQSMTSNPDQDFVERVRAWVTANYDWHFLNGELEAQYRRLIQGDQSRFQGIQHCFQE